MTPAQKWKIVRIVLTTIYLFAGWLVFTGTLSPYSLLMGTLRVADEVAVGFTGTRRK